MKIAIVGCGEHLKASIFPAIRMIPNISVIDIFSKSTESAKDFAQKWGIERTHSKFYELNSNNVDAIVCSGPVELHEEVSNFAIERGIPLFIEKPIANNIDNLLKILHKAEKNNAFVRIGYNLRYGAGIQKIKSLTFGKIKKIDIEYGVNKPKAPLWNLSSLEQSFLLAIAVHPLNLASFFIENNPTNFEFDLKRNNDDIDLKIQLIYSTIVRSTVKIRNTDKKFNLKIRIITNDNDIYELNDLNKIIKSNSENDVVEEVFSLSPLKLVMDASGYAKQIESFFEELHINKHGNYSDISNSVWIYRLFSQILLKGSLNEPN